FIDGVAQGPAAALYRHDLGSQGPHLEDVQLLPANVLRANVDLALQTEKGSRRGGGHAVLAGPRLGDDARLAHAPRQQRLPDTVIDLVRAGVVEVLALQIDPGTAGLTRQPFGKGQGGWAAHIVLQVVVKLPLKLRVLTGVFIMFGELPQRVHERFRNEATAIRAEATLSIGDGRSGNGHGNVTLKRKTNGAAALAAGID